MCSIQFITPQIPCSIEGFSEMATETQIECRVEYVVGTAIFILRWFTRAKLRMWKLDDYFSISAWTFFTLIYAMVEYLCELAFCTCG